MVTEAVQIIETDGERLTLNEEALRNILMNDDVKDKKVCIVSITGIFRQGKSFLLNFFLRYLKLLSVNGEPPSDWLDTRYGPDLNGFAWRHGSTSHTRGIFMWPEVFTVQVPSLGEEIGVILMDTQGIFDNESTSQNSASIFAISTLISSVQIYNIMRNIDQSHLDHLETFGYYGRMLANSDQNPFQNLCFLIRDWFSTFEYQFGRAGGQQFLEERLNGGRFAEIDNQRRHIRELFSQLDCFLLPFPGYNVAGDNNFTGHLDAIDNVFKQHVQEFVELILASENLVVKVVNGEKVTAQGMYEMLVAYARVFEDGLPNFESRFQAEVKRQHREAIENCVQKYTDKMRINFSAETDFYEHHNYCKQSALSVYDNTNIFGSDDDHQHFKEELNRRLNQQFSLYRERFREREERERQRRNLELLSEQNSVQRFLSPNVASVVSTRDIMSSSINIISGVATVALGICGIIGIVNSRNSRSSSNRRYSSSSGSSTDS